MSAPTKPKGILYITILYLAIAAILVVVAILCFAPSAAYPGQSMAYEIWNNTVINLPQIGDNFDRWFTELFVPYIAVWGVVAIIIGAIVAVVAILLFQMKVMGRNLTMLIALPLIAVLLGLIVLWYLFKDDVKAAFTPAAISPTKSKAK